MLLTLSDATTTAAAIFAAALLTALALVLLEEQEKGERERLTLFASNDDRMRSWYVMCVCARMFV